MWSSALPEDSRACVAELPDVNPVTILRVILGVAFELGHDLINFEEVDLESGQRLRFTSLDRRAPFSS